MHYSIRDSDTGRRKKRSCRGCPLADHIWVELREPTGGHPRVRELAHKLVT